MNKNLGVQHPSERSDGVAQSSLYNFMRSQTNSIKRDCALEKKHPKSAVPI